MTNWTEALDAEFWESFIGNLRPFDSNQEERMIKALAAHTKLSPDFLRGRMEAYLYERFAPAPTRSTESAP